MTSAPHALECRGLSKRFRGGRMAVNDVTLTVPHGSVYGLVGPNGAGKTTLMRTALGFMPSTAGTSTVLGHTIPGERRSAWPRVGVIIEEPRFYPFLSGRRNLLQISSLLGLQERRVNEVLDQVGLGTRADDAVRTYSLGMRQRLGIARALLPNPKLLVLDEPLNGLDPPGIREMRDLLVRWAGDGGAVLVSSHLLSELEQVCDHIAVLDQGRLISDGPIGQFGTHEPTLIVEVVDGDLPAAAQVVDALESVEEAQVTEGGLVITYSGQPEDAAAVNAALVGAGFAIAKLQPMERTLEQRFLDVVGEQEPT